VSSWRRVYARTNTVVMRLDTQGLVRQLTDNVYTVDLEAKICSCIVFQENSIPCGYAITTIFACPNRNLTSYTRIALYFNMEKDIYLELPPYRYL
jgi:hypothetical protein